MLETVIISIAYIIFASVFVYIASVKEERARQRIINREGFGGLIESEGRP
ncbi:MAG: hypothetical protein JKY81_01750 [Colwellia sp.]|nr:hypothetical protein [Colwellia sp.]